MLQPRPERRKTLPCGSVSMPHLSFPHLYMASSSGHVLDPDGTSAGKQADGLWKGAIALNRCHSDWKQKISSGGVGERKQ
jgi:hypothetical protein